MRLTDLEPQFVRSWVASASPGWKRGWSRVDRFEMADGVMFLCPVCFERDDAHQILCWTPEAPDDLPPGPGRWRMSGTGYDDLSLSGPGGTSSIMVPGGCRAHFYVHAGEIVFC